MSRSLAIALAALLGGCSVGFGSAYVGQWRARDHVEFEACLEDDAGGCRDHKQTITHAPDRRFWGILLQLPVLGVSSVTVGDQTSTRVRVMASGEVLWGRGRLAGGVRGGFLLDGDSAWAWPVAAVGHYALTERISVHAGLGASPYATTTDETSWLGGYGLVGLQVALARTQTEHHVVLTIESDALWQRFDDPYRSFGWIATLGYFF